ncbi:MAG: hypothetical protein WC781_01205 [Candidatus Pacearchaeota archaeon]|jgi:hypothetical protein
MNKKSFFNEREAGEIRNLDVERTYNARGLVNKIIGLNPDCEAVEIRFPITPGRFLVKGLNGAEASRKCYKHGDLIALSQPESQQEAYNCVKSVLAIRARDFHEQLESRKEEDIDFVGYSFRPVQGRNRVKRVVPFVWCPEAVRLWGYGENMTNGINVNVKYTDSKKVKYEGGEVLCDVPSRTRKESRYKFKLLHVPIDGSTERSAIVWGLQPALVVDEESGEIKSKRIPHDFYRIKYTKENDREGSQNIVFYPHDIAAYIGIIKQLYSRHNLTPLEMNPFMLVSKKGADFYKRICNNVLIFDPTLESKDKLRKLHIDEKSILFARAIGVLGHDEIAYWDAERDGKLKDYNWRI